MSISDSQQKREAVVEDFRTIRLSSGRNLTEDTPQTAVSPWDYPVIRSCGFSQDQLKDYDDSDAESHGSEEEILENAGVWNIEEAHRILRDKMKKLQKLYTLQMKHLHMEYKTQRRKYLLDKAQCLNRTKTSLVVPESGTTFQDYKVHSTKQISRELLIKAKTRQCLRQYCKKRGIDAVLYKRQQARKQQQTLSMYNKQQSLYNKHDIRGKEINKFNSLYSSSTQSIQLLKEEDMIPKSTQVMDHKLLLDKLYTEQGLVAGRCKTCDDLALPLAMHCKEHIIKDSKQLVYTYCTHTGCKRVVTINERCDYHPYILDLLPPKQSSASTAKSENVQVKQEPETQDKGTSTIKPHSTSDKKELDNGTQNVTSKTLEVKHQITDKKEK